MHSTLTPDALAEALRRAIDPEHPTLFSLSGYEGERPILGEVNMNKFRLQKRRVSRNDFAGHFYGEIEAESGGAKIEGYFAAPRWARYFMRIWLGLAVIIGAPIVVSTLRDVITNQRKLSGDLWVGLVVPPLLIFFGTGLPRMAQRLGKGDRRTLINFVQQVGAAKVDDIDSAVRSTRPPW